MEQLIVCLVGVAPQLRITRTLGGCQSLLAPNVSIVEVAFFEAKEREDIGNLRIFGGLIVVFAKFGGFFEVFVSLLGIAHILITQSNVAVRTGNLVVGCVFKNIQ